MRFVLVAALLVASVALAQRQEPARQPQPVRELIIEDGDTVTGGAEGPANTLVVAPPERAPHTSLIQLRDNFNEKVAAESP